jgi:3-(3-hydroxy-phenyl)propionate hydroxylase
MLLMVVVTVQPILNLAAISLSDPGRVPGGGVGPPGAGAPAGAGAVAGEPAVVDRLRPRLAAPEVDHLLATVVDAAGSAELAPQNEAASNWLEKAPYGPRGVHTAQTVYRY